MRTRAMRTRARAGMRALPKKRTRMDDTYYSYDPKRKEGARGIAARIRRNKQVLVLAGLFVAIAVASELDNFEAQHPIQGMQQGNNQ